MVLLVHIEPTQFSLLAILGISIIKERRMNDIKQEVFEIQRNLWNKTDLTIMLAEEEYSKKIRSFLEYINILTGTIAEALENGKK